MIPCLSPGWIRHCFCYRWGGDSHINRSLQYNVIKSVSYRRTYPICACQERLSRNWPELRGWQPIPHNCVLSIYMFPPARFHSLVHWPHFLWITVLPSGDWDKELDFLVNVKQTVHPTASEAMFLMKVRHWLSSEMSQVISAKTLIFGPALIK